MKRATIKAKRQIQAKTLGLRKGDVDIEDRIKERWDQVGVYRGLGWLFVSPKGKDTIFDRVAVRHWQAWTWVG